MAANISTTALQKLFNYYNEHILRYRVFELLVNEKPSKKRTAMIRELTIETPLDRVRGLRATNRSLFDETVKEIRTNSLTLANYLDLKKYHFYLIKEISDLESGSSEFIKIFTEKYQSNNNNRAAAKDASATEQLAEERERFVLFFFIFMKEWDEFKIKIGKEIEWEVDETIKFERSLKSVVPSVKTKLKWNGNKNQLYSVLRQLKNHNELIGNSYNSLADFLIENVTGFENTAKETIEKELKKKSTLPKNRRIEIDIDKEGEE